jgi:hypothetical protein
MHHRSKHKNGPVLTPPPINPVARTLVFLKREFEVLFGRNLNPISSLTLEKRLSAC